MIFNISRSLLRSHKETMTSKAAAVVLCSGRYLTGWNKKGGGE
jgi:hypothetical protein